MYPDRYATLREPDLSGETLVFTYDLAQLYRKLGQYAEAERWFVETLRIRRSSLGDGYPDTLESTYNLGVLYYRQGRYSEAESLMS